MASDDIPLMAMLKGRLGYLADRQKLIAENVANSDTPGFAPRDLKPFTFASKMRSAAASSSAIGSVGGIGGIASPGMASSGLMAVTQPGHMQISTGKGAQAQAKGAPDSEMTIDRNGVTLEDQMIKLTDTRMDYDAAISFYQQSMGMLRTAIKKPGG